jgi:toxin YhaV
MVEETLRAVLTALRERCPGLRLTAIRQLAFEVTPQDPVRPEYQQGHTLGDARRHWFRFHAASHIIVLAWVNDEDTRRTIGMICWHKPAL